MKICIVAYKFGTESEIGAHLGTYHYFIEKLRTLVCKGHEVTVVAPWLSLTKKGSLNVDGVRVVRYYPPLIPALWLGPVHRLIRWLYMKQTQRQVLKTIHSSGAQIVYVYQAREAGYAVARIKDKLGVPFVFRQITAWHWHFERSMKEVYGKRSWYKLIAKIGLRGLLDWALLILSDRANQIKFAKTIYKKADEVVFLSHAAIAESESLGLDSAKTATLGVAIEEDLFSPTKSKDELKKQLDITAPKVITFIGRINFAEKGVGVLLEAMPTIIAAVPDVLLVIVGGGGESERMETLIAKLKIEKHVMCVGKKPFVELPRYINIADVFVVPSIWMEAFGQVTIEAMSCGVPVVTSDAGASPEINLNNQTGLVVPANDASLLASALIAVLQDEALAQKLGQAARQRVLDNYTYDKITERFITIISSL